MPESSRDALVAQIEAAIEKGGLDEARQLIEAAEKNLGRQPELDELRQRLSVVESTLSGHGQVEVAIRRAREEVSRANYPGALATLERALRLAPGDAELRGMLEQTTKAAVRHEAAVERNRAVAQTAEDVGALLERGDLEKATAELREAGLKFGKHNTLTALQQRLDTLWKQAELEKTVAYVEQGLAFLDGNNWQAAAQQAERILRLDPKNTDALELKKRAKEEMEREEVRRQVSQEIEKAGQDVERLIGADELPRASQALKNHIDRLGRHDIFDDLARRVDEAKAELQARKRLEWTQRRLKEAEDLVRQAGRLSLQGKYDLAIERLGAARDLHPDHPEIDGMLQAARTAQKRELDERRRSGALQAGKLEIRQLLDALRLDEAATRLAAATAKFGEEDPQLQALATRLTRLREAESTASAFPETGDDTQAEAAALARQEALAAAYSWKQILLFPFRGDAASLFWILLGSIVALEALDSLPWVGGLLRVLRWLLPVAALGLSFETVRETLRGKNRLPPWNHLFDGKRWGLDLAALLVIAVAATAPLAVLLATRGWHGLFGGASGWWTAALLAWLGAALAVTAAAAAGAFGRRQIARIAGHVRALVAGEPDTLIAVNLIFAVLVALVVLRATFLPFVPWLGSPLAGALEAWALVTVPHLIGVVARRHRVELARIYR